MGKKERIGYDKIELEAERNNGNIGKWEEVASLANQKPEYWSKDAVEQKPLGGKEGLYPQYEDESDEDYQARLQHINQYAQNEVTKTTPPQENIPHIYDESDEDNNILHGYMFRKRPRTPKEINELGLKVFNTQEILGSSDDVRENKIIMGIKDLRREKHLNIGGQSKSDAARYYIGPLSSLEKNIPPGALQNDEKDRKRYSDKDQRNLEKKKSIIAISDARADEDAIFRQAGKMLEGFFYPLFEQGFFDSGKNNTAGLFLASEYDDLFNGVDAAIVLPLHSYEGDGKEAVVNQPLSFDLTVSPKSSKTKIETLKNKHGLTKIDYPSTIQKKELPPMDQIPNFVICLPKDREETAFVDGLIKGNLPSAEIQLLINYQIWRQATHFAEYWRDQPDHLDDAKAFARISNFFGERVNFGAENAKRLGLFKNLDDFIDDHRRALEYLDFVK